MKWLYYKHSANECIVILLYYYYIEQHHVMSPFSFAYIFLFDSSFHNARLSLAISCYLSFLIHTAVGLPYKQVNEH